MAGSFIPKKHWLDLEVETYRLLKQHNVRSRSILVAVSGGADSTALAILLTEISRALELKIHLAHIHHGTEAAGRPVSPETVAYRDAAAGSACSMAKRLGTICHVEYVRVAGAGEAGLRAARLDALRRLRVELKADMTAFAHHSDDLLETRLIRLIRGSGLEGLRSMSPVDGRVLRPLLTTSRDRIRRYVESKGAPWVEDPSNRDPSPLRNWVRTVWLPLLEQKRPGAGDAIARSLEMISSQHSTDWTGDYYDARGVKRARLLELGVPEQRQVLASFLRHRRVQNYSLSHVEEVLKRLGNPQNDFAFRCLNREWKINAEYIEII